LQHALNVVDTFAGAARSSQNIGGANSSQNTKGVPHQSPSWAPSPGQVIRQHAGYGQQQVEDWEEEVSEDEVTTKEELARVQQEIERLHQEQEAITRRQAAAHRAEARRQYIDKEKARLAKLRQAVDILRQQEQRKEPPFDQAHRQPNPHSQPPPQYGTIDAKGTLADNL
jgi:hypothetical protein